jgi:hypothetical protein
MSTLALPRSEASARATAKASDWPLWCAGASSVLVAFGVHWDIAWHRSIGRDAFWSPPHVAIYAGAVFAAVAALVRILPSTFGAGRTRNDGLSVLGFRGSLGSFIACWGGVTMLSSAPFDDWWHRTYGLDVKILSPPHVVLALGIIALHVGALTTMVGAMNRSDTPQRRAALRASVVVVGAMLLVTILTLFMEETLRIAMHLGSFYAIVAACAPFVAVAMVEATGWVWAGTAAVGVYSAFLLALLWTFPLVPAEPKLGPVFVAVHCLLPPEFPLLLVPAVAASEAWRSRGGKGRVIGGALIFAAVFLVLQWPFADFLMSPAARNYFWGARYIDYASPDWDPYRRYVFLTQSNTARVVGIFASFVIAGVAATAGRAAGRWLGRLQR